MCDRGGHRAAGSRAASRGGDARDFQYPTEHWGEPGRAGPLFLPQTPSRPPARPARPPVRQSVSRGPAERNFARSRPGRRPAACAHARSASLLLLPPPPPPSRPAPGRARPPSAAGAPPEGSGCGWDCRGLGRSWKGREEAGKERLSCGTRDSGGPPVGRERRSRGFDLPPGLVRPARRRRPRAEGFPIGCVI